jgi:hypothetical protein
MKPHKHAELIKAWADGAEIQFRRYGETDWQDAGHNPQWLQTFDYRIKPKSNNDIVYETHIKYDFGWKWVNTSCAGLSNLRLTFDNKTGKLTSARVI